MADEEQTTITRAEVVAMHDEAVARGDKNTAKLCGGIEFLATRCDLMRDTTTALAKEARRIFPNLKFNIETPDPSLMEKIAEPLSKMVANVLDEGAMPNMKPEKNETGFIFTKSHWAVM